MEKPVNSLEFTGFFCYSNLMMMRIFAMEAGSQDFTNDKWTPYLSKERRLEAEKRRIEKDRRLFLGAEILLNRALELAAPGIPRPAEYVRNEHGKPYLASKYGIYVNWSHSGDYVLLGIADREIGVDLQNTAREPKESLVRRVLQPEETAFYRKHEKARQKELFYDYWVLKESFLKTLGTGFQTSLKDFYVELGGIYPVIVQNINKKTYHCRLLSFADPDYRAAVCWEGAEEEEQMEIVYLS